MTLVDPMVARAGDPDREHAAGHGAIPQPRPAAVEDDADGAAVAGHRETVEIERAAGDRQAGLGRADQVAIEPLRCGDHLAAVDGERRPGRRQQKQRKRRAAAAGRNDPAHRVPSGCALRG